MARLKTKLELIERTRSQLGEPQINVEVSDPQISEIIDDTVQKFTEYAWGTLEAVAILELEGMGNYALPDTITNIIKMSKGATSNITNFGTNFGSGYVPDMWSQQYFQHSLTGDIMPAIIAISNTKSILDKYFGDKIAYNFNYLRKQLQVQENYHGHCALHYEYEYIAIDEGPDFIFNHEWIKDYTKAKVKELWSGITGKFTQTLVGGGTINFDKMAQEAEAEITRLNEELLTKWSDPAPVSIS